MIDVLPHTDTVAVGLDNMEGRVVVVVGIPSDVHVYIQQQQQQRHHDLDSDQIRRW